MMKSQPWAWSHLQMVMGPLKILVGRHFIMQRRVFLLAKHILSPCWMKVVLFCLPYVTLTHRASSSFLSFMFDFVKESISSFLLLFSIIQVRGTIIFFLLFLFGLRAWSALYHLESFYITYFCSPVIKHVLYKIYNYVILKHVSHIQVTRYFSNSTHKHT